jgi:hypothetical protein
MRKATESLIQTTSLVNNPLFSCHDNVTELDWEKIIGWLELNNVDPREESLIWFLGYLDGQNDYNLDSINVLEEHEVLAVLESLKIAWSGIELQENL